MHGLNLSSCLRRFLYNGLSSSTRATYRGAQVSYENFCAREGFPTWPAKRIPIAEWLAYRAMGSLDEPAVRPNVLRQYLSHLRSVHVDRCYSVRVFDENALFLRVLEGVSRLLPPVDKRKSEALTVERLHKLLSPPDVELVTFPQIDELNFRAACLVAFAAFLRPGEFTYTAKSLDNRYVFEQTKLLRSDITFAQNDEYCILHLKRSKTDYQHVGVDIIIAGTGDSFCPVQALRLLFKGDKGLPNAPLFRFSTGAFTINRVLSMLRTKLSERHFTNARDFTGKCWRRGAAQTAENRGMSEHDRKKLGRWSSDAFKLYFDEDKKSLFGLNSRLLTGLAPPL